VSVGISTACFYPEITENAVRYLCENGVPSIEIFFNSACEMQGEIFSKVKSSVLQSSVRVTSVHPFSSAFEPFMLFSEYERRFEDGLELYKRYFDACNALGAKTLVLHGDKADRKHCDDRYIDRFYRLFSAAKSQGVTLAQENVAYCRSNDIEFLKRMKAELKDDVAFVLDLKQARRAGVCWREYASVMGNKLVHLHANDYDETHDCLLPGKGITDFSEIYSCLYKNGFKGDSVIEVYRLNYSEHSELISSMKYLEGFEEKK